eukprot:9247842-Pyramimonas_sp.AAC.1
MQSSELGLLPELGSQLFCCSCHPERCCRFSALISGCRGAAGVVMTGVDSQTSDAPAGRMQ